jgi:hypothetical protein
MIVLRRTKPLSFSDQQLDINALKVFATLIFDVDKSCAQRTHHVVASILASILEPDIDT